MSRIWSGKSVLWALLAVPAAFALYRYVTEPGMWPGDLLHPTGEWSARFIIIALMLTPLAQLFPASHVIKWLVRNRRAFGLAGFAYALLHLVFYVLDMETIAAMLAEIGAPAIWTGWAAMLCLVPPALASSDTAMRLLKRNWKRVQRLVYPAAVLTLVHWVLIHDGKVAAIAHFAPLILLQALRRRNSFTDQQPKG